MYSIETKIRVSYGMTDQMGYVYFGSYPEFYDMGRTELLRALGVEPAKLERKGILLPVRDLQITYCSPAFYDEDLVIETSLQDYGPLKLDFYFRIFNSERKLINLGRLKMIFVDSVTRKPRRSWKIVKQINEGIYHDA